MALLFLETSALAKRYIIEEGTPHVLELFESEDRLAVSRLALVEVTSAVVRRAKAGDISGDDLVSLLQTLEDDFRTRFSVIELAAATITRSVDLVRAYALRAADAIQLGCALMAAGGSPHSSNFLFVSSDEELNAAARKEGFTILDPQRD